MPVIGDSPAGNIRRFTYGKDNIECAIHARLSEYREKYVTNSDVPKSILAKFGNVRNAGRNSAQRESGRHFVRPLAMLFSIISRAIMRGNNMQIKFITRNWEFSIGKTSRLFYFGKCNNRDNKSVAIVFFHMSFCLYTRKG
jgi:hypothetical protein